MKAILGFTRMSVRGLNKVKRELGFVLMALNIRKVVAQRAENNQKFIKRQFLYYFNRNCLFHYQELYVPDSLIENMLKMPGYNRGTKRKKCIPFKISVSLEMSASPDHTFLMYANFPYALTKFGANSKFGGFERNCSCRN